MSYKTVIAALQQKSHAARILPAAIEIARRNDAHLIGLHAVPRPVRIPTWGGIEDIGQLLHAIEERAREEAASIKSAFDAMIAQVEPLSTEWAADQSPTPEVSDTIVKRARRADLILASQGDPEDHSIDAGDLPANLALQSGRPVLFIPYVGAPRTVAERVLIGWNGSREAARAVFDALPLLKSANEVTMICAQEDAEAPILEGAELAAALARHGVSATVSNTPAADDRASDILLSRAADIGADLIVTGAYGRSRAREYVFGGVTRDLLRTMTVPVLMSH